MWMRMPLEIISRCYRKLRTIKKLLKSPLDLSDVLLFKDEWLKAEKKEISDDEVSSLSKNL